MDVKVLREQETHIFEKKLKELLIQGYELKFYSSHGFAAHYDRYNYLTAILIKYDRE